MNPEQRPSTSSTAPVLRPPRASERGDTPPASDAPYAAAQATPTCAEGAALKPMGTLPPIATARPLGHISEIQSHLRGGSNIPLSSEAQQASGRANNQGDLPYVTVMTMAPSAVQRGADADLDDSRFQFLQRARWTAAAMLAYYLVTFILAQPFVLGVLGIATGFVGYLSARAPVDLRRIKWVRWYVWLNYAMMVLNLWLLVLAFVAIGAGGSFLGSSSDSTDDQGDRADGLASTSSGGADPYADLSSYYSSSLGMYVGVLVGFNMVVHLRGLRSAKLLLAELVAVGFAQPVATATAV